METALKSTRRTFTYLIFVVFSILYLAFFIESINNFSEAKVTYKGFIYALYVLSVICYIASIITLLVPSYSRRVINSVTPMKETVIEESITEIEVNGQIIRNKETVVQKQDPKKRQITLFALFHILLVISGFLSIIPLILIVII